MTGNLPPDQAPTPLPAVVRHRAHQRPGRSHRLTVRLSTDEHDLVRNAARAVGLTPAGFAGKSAVAAAAGEITPMAGPVDVLRELQRELFAARRAVNLLAATVTQADAGLATGGMPVWPDEAVALCRAVVARVDEVTARIDGQLR